jgi:hypothetical protein
VIQTVLLSLLFAAWSGDAGLLRKHLGLHSILANVCPLKPLIKVSTNKTTTEEQYHRVCFIMAGLDPRRGISSVRVLFIDLTCRTFFVAFCCLVQIQMLFDIPTSLSPSDLDSILPSSEEAWSAENAVKWLEIQTSGNAPPTPTFKETFQKLFSQNVLYGQAYSEFGGYIMISGILSTILDDYRRARLSLEEPDMSKFDIALDNWQKLWHADPKSHSTGPSSPFGAMAFNASAIYRGTCIRRVRDYSKYIPPVH